MMFDPYRKWLGIPPKDQPPNYYRLLGLELFENDLDVIEGAADRQMGFVRQYQSGEYAAEAAKILNELAVARLCLLKPATKAAYDAKLRQELAPPEPEMPQISADDLQGEAIPRKRKKKPSKPIVDQGLIVKVGIVAGVVIVVLFLLTSRPKPQVEVPKQPDQVAATSGAKPGIDAGKPAEAPTTGSATVTSVLWSEPKLVTEPASQPVDLLKLVDLKRDVLAGKWEQTSTALIGDRGGRLYLPTQLPDDYQLKFAVRRLEGNDSLIVGFTMAGRQGMAVIDGWNSTSSGLYVDALEPKNNCATWRGKLLTQRTAQVVLTVHPGHLHATVDGRTIVDWYGNPERLFLGSWFGFQMASRESPFLAPGDSKYVFESATLIPIKPELPLARLARLDREIEVLPLMDLDRDVQRGIWGINKNSLYSPEGWGQIYLPTVVPEEYTLSTTVEASPNPHGDALTIGLVADKSYFQFVSTDVASGLDLIDGQRWDNNETRLEGPLLKPAVPVRVDCTVTKNAIRVEADGKTLVDWQGDFRRLSMPGDWALADGKRLYLGATRHLKFRDIKLTVPLPPPKSPDHKPITTNGPVDLLALIDPQRDARYGTWTLEGGVLRTLADVDLTKLVVPVDLPDEYQLTMRIAREPGGRLGNDAINLTLPVGKSKADLVVDGTFSQFTGISVGKTDWNGNATLYKGTVIPPGPAVEIVIQVKASGFKVTSRGKQIIDWTGNPDNLWSPPHRAAPGQRIGIAAWQSRFRIDKLEVQALPASNLAKVPAWPSTGKLMPIINVDRDTRRGDWKLDGDALTCPVTEGCRLQIPVTVPERYVFSATVERKQGTTDLFLGLVVGGHPCAVAVDGINRTVAGIDLIDGKRFFDPVNLAGRKYQAPLLPDNQPVVIRCYVLPDTIVVTMGDKEVIRWHGDPRRLSELPDFIPSNYSEADRTHLCLGAWMSSFSFRDLELRLLSDTEAEELSKSFSDVFPTTSQADVPFVTSKK